MNGRELSKATPVDLSAANTTEEHSSDDEELERWASVVAGCLLHPQVQPPPPPVGFEFGAAPAAPEGWRQSVGVLTQDPRALGEVIAENPVSPSGTGFGTSAIERIQVRVNTKEFGEVSLVIERAEQGLRILLGAVDGRVVSALRNEANAVRRALESGGQSVGSLEIVRMNELGTVLAQTKVAPSNRLRRLKEAADAASNPTAGKKKTRRINLIG
jgi:hypothetical protein